MMEGVTCDIFLCLRLKSLECLYIVLASPGYIAYNFVLGAYSYWGPKAGYNIYNMVCSHFIPREVRSQLTKYVFMTLLSKLLLRNLSCLRSM